MNAALEKIQAMGCQEVFLWTDSRDKWYSRQGWNEIHRLPFELVEAVVMKKTVEKNIDSLK
jgi:N-acetylglutamate synthase-like GNAT family acetyltransferase